MTSSGIPSLVPQDSVKIPVRVLVIGVSVLLLALFVATQVVGVLYAMVFPPLPPVPDSVTELNYDNEAPGVDYWVYGTDQDACQIIQYYQEAGGTCSVAPIYCGDPNTDTFYAGTTGQNVGMCRGSDNFSIFGMRWEVIIATNYEIDGRTHFRVSREVLWSGSPADETP